MLLPSSRTREHYSAIEDAVLVAGNEVKLTKWTLGAIKARSMALEGYCETPGCGQFYVFKVEELIEGFGAEWLVPEILPATCQQCGGRLRFKLAMMTPGE